MPLPLPISNWLQGSVFSVLALQRLLPQTASLCPLWWAQPGGPSRAGPPTGFGRPVLPGPSREWITLCTVSFFAAYVSLNLVQKPSTHEGRGSEAGCRGVRGRDWQLGLTCPRARQGTGERSDFCSLSWGAPSPGQSHSWSPRPGIRIPSTPQCCSPDRTAGPRGLRLLRPVRSFTRTCPVCFLS